VLAPLAPSLFDTEMAPAQCATGIPVKYGDYEDFNYTDDTSWNHRRAMLIAAGGAASRAVSSIVPRASRGVWWCLLDWVARPLEPRHHVGSHAHAMGKR